MMESKRKVKKCKKNVKRREENLDVKTTDSKDLAISRLKNTENSNMVDVFSPLHIINTI